MRPRALRSAEPLRLTALELLRKGLLKIRPRMPGALPPAMEIAQLVVSELATNVCKYAPGPCLLDLETDGALLDIMMWDSGPVLPAASPADPTRIGRHGLELVLMVCQSFAIHREPVGKRIRVQIPLHDDTDVSSGW